VPTHSISRIVRRPPVTSKGPPANNNHSGIRFYELRNK
jgi:hypothetical protein